MERLKFRPRKIQEVQPHTQIQESPGLPVELESQYWQMRPEIKAFYRRVGSWHGMGRMRKKGTIDNLAEILQKGEISPRMDHWDVKSSETISLTHIRTNACKYADVHEQQGDKELVYKDQRNWNRPLGRLYLRRPTSILSLMRHGRHLYTTSKQNVRPWLESKAGQTLAEGSNLHHARRWSRLRSSMPGDYSILVGVEKDAYEKIPIAKYLEPQEERTDKPIPLEKLTHIEVPLKFVKETQELIRQYGRTLPVLAREFGERYQSEFDDYEILTGLGFQEDEYPLPANPTSVDTLKRFVPHKEWFISPEYSERLYHGTDHLLRVLVLQETITNLLLESGTISSDQVDREALRWSAIAHDLRRHSDYRNKDHAQEGANWILHVLPHDMSQTTKDKIYKIVQGHDRKIPSLSDVATELAILKDADKLERIRLTKRLPAVFTPSRVRRKIGLDPERLHFEVSRRLIPMANDLYRLSMFDESQRIHSPEEAVFSSAARLGVLAA